MKIRRFEKYSKSDKIRLLLSALTSALQEDLKFRKTDIYGIAKQYYSFLRKEDFELIKNMTMSEIVNLLDRKENNNQIKKIKWQ